MVRRTSSCQDEAVLGKGLAVLTCAVTVPSTVPLPLTGLLSEGIPKTLVRIPCFNPVCSGAQPLSQCHFVTPSHCHTPTGLRDTAPVSPCVFPVDNTSYRWIWTQDLIPPN